MADMTLCSDDKCPKKESCLRFTAKPSGPWQSYQKFNWYMAGVKEDGILTSSWTECDGFWEKEDGKK